MNSNFENYLKSLGISSKSLKNYKSDCLHFFSWAKEALKVLGVSVENIIEASPFFSHEFVSEYINHLITNKIPNKTINRRLSTLRHLSRFLITSAVIDLDFMSQTSNMSLSKKQQLTDLTSHPIVSEFQAHLELQKVSKNTIKNYMSDVRQFLTWLENNHARLT